MKKVVGNILYPLFVVLVILLFWQLAAWIINVELILPTPIEAFKNIGSYVSDKNFWVSLGYSYLRSLESFIIAFIVAMLFAVLAYLYKTLEKLINPFVAIVRAIPTMAIILILVISISPTIAPVVIAGIVIFPTLYQAFISSFKEIDLNLVEMVNAYKVSKKDQVFKFYIPSIMPGVLNNSIAAFSLNIKLIIAAEALAQTRNSIGNLMQYAKISLEVEKLFALTIIAVIISVLSEIVLKFIAKKVCHNA